MAGATKDDGEKGCTGCHMEIKGPPFKVDREFPGGVKIKGDFCEEECADLHITYVLEAGSLLQS